MHVHASFTDFCIPKRLSGEHISGQHPRCVSTICCAISSTVPLGFCCGGFSSTAGYVPGNEAQCRSIERLRYLLAVPFQKMLFVFIRTTRKVLQLF